MKWRKRKQPLRAIPHIGIPIGNPRQSCDFKSLNRVKPGLSAKDQVKAWGFAWIGFK